MNKLSQVLKSSRAAIDLASIMVGIIVIGLIGGVIAATVFTVIPWSQDNAAKQQLDSVQSAENASMGLKGNYSSTLINLYNALDAKTFISSDEKNCFIAVQKSATGNYFYTTSSSSAPKKIAAGAWPTTAPANLPAGCSWPTEDTVKALPNLALQKLLNEAVVNVQDPAGYVSQSVNLQPSKGFTLASSWSVNNPQGNQTIMGQEGIFKLQQRTNSMLVFSGDTASWTGYPEFKNSVDSTGGTSAVVASVTATGGSFYAPNVTSSPTNISKVGANITTLSIGGYNPNGERVSAYGSVKQALAWDRTLTPAESTLVYNYLKQS
jgi:hypothetical protein